MKPLKLSLQLFLIPMLFIAFSGCQEEQSRAVYINPTYNTYPVKDPRESTSAQNGLCDAVFEENIENIVYFLKRTGGSATDKCWDYKGTDSMGYTSYHTPISMALLKVDSNVSVYDTLIEFSTIQGSDTHSLTKGNTFFHHAVLASEKALKILAKRSSRGINTLNDGGATPLILSLILPNSVTLAEILLMNGADPNIPFKAEGQNIFPADIALSQKNFELFDLLKKHGGNSVFESQSQSRGDLISKCITDFADNSDSLKSEHLKIKKKIEAQFNYSGLEDVLAGKTGFAELGISIHEPIKSEYESFSASLQRALRKNSLKYAADKCNLKAGALSDECQETHARFSACFEMAKKGKHLDSL